MESNNAHNVFQGRPWKPHLWCFSFRDGSEVMTCVSDGMAMAISRGTKLLRWHIPLSSVAYWNLTECHKQQTQTAGWFFLSCDLRDEILHFMIVSIITWHGPWHRNPYMDQPICVGGSGLVT